MSSVHISWHGDEVRARYRRAVARGTIGVGTRVQNTAKQIVHVVTGDLRRSIHTAKSDGTGVIPATAENVGTEQSGALLDVGSWIAYACVEEIGRKHMYMQPALEAVAPTATATMMAAFIAEGFVPDGPPGSATFTIPHNRPQPPPRPGRNKRYDS